MPRDIRLGGVTTAESASLLSCCMDQGFETTVRELG